MKHQDIKPSNILLHIVPKEDRPRPIMTDFGHSVQFSLNSKNGTGSPVTVYYSAPETFDYDKTAIELEEGGVGRPQDVFSLGFVFLELALVIVGSGRQRLRKKVLANGGSYGKSIVAVNGLINGTSNGRQSSKRGGASQSGKKKKEKGDLIPQDIE
ncbi:hypothetical protein HDV00_010467 [Rhizophlyctis rosea]|nr:hypothetical protein HDV00_010467 [Rhizophlyctis rosea]